MKTKYSFIALASIIFVSPIIFSTSCNYQTCKFVRISDADSFYKLDYKGNYHFNDMLHFEASPNLHDPESSAKGVASDTSMRYFLSKQFYNNKQIPLPIWSPIGGACDSFNSYDATSNSWNFSRNFDYFYDQNEISDDFWTHQSNDFTPNPNYNSQYRAPSALVHTAPTSPLEVNYLNTHVVHHDPVESMSLVYLPFFMGSAQPNVLQDKNNYWKIAPYFAFDGMNKNGVSISINVSGNAQTTHQKSPDDFDTGNCDRVNLNSFALVRMILDYAQNLDDALELMSNFYLNDLSFENAEPIHYQISDKNGNSAIVEFEEGYIMPSIIMTGDIVASADTEFDYSITGTGKNFLINENFNLNNLYGEMKTEGFDTWADLNEYISDELIESMPNNDLRWAECYGRYYLVKNLLQDCGGVTNDPMNILFKTRMYKWNTWSVVYDLTNGTTKVVYMQQYDKPAYTFSF